MNNHLLRNKVKLIALMLVFGILPACETHVSATATNDSSNVSTSISKKIPLPSLP